MEVELTTPKLQINDFNFEGWSAEGTAAAPESPKVAEAGDKVEEPTESGKPVEIHSLLSRETLTSLNARIEPQLRQVLSGADTVGEGQMVVALEEGRFSISPLDLSVPGGSVQLNFGYEPVAGGVELTLDLRADRFDYGILARRVDPETTMGGMIFLDVELESSAQNMGGLMQGGSGHFDFALLPVEFDAGIFDLWAVNLLSALSKKMDGEPDSVINCVLARFTMEQGNVRDRIIFMDRTRMSVLGKASVDFNKSKLDVYAKPEAKRPEFFSVAIPVGVTGDFDDWGLDIGIVPVAWAGLSFLTSPVHVPVRRLFQSGEPSEGEEACRQAWLESEKPLEEPALPKSKAFQ